MLSTETLSLNNLGGDYTRGARVKGRTVLAYFFPKSEAVGASGDFKARRKAQRNQKSMSKLPTNHVLTACLGSPGTSWALGRCPGVLNHFRDLQELSRIFWIVWGHPCSSAISKNFMGYSGSFQDSPGLTRNILGLGISWAVRGSSGIAWDPLGPLLLGSLQNLPGK